MAKGYPDWHRGSLMQGLRDGVPTGINMDDLGNLIALLKGNYNDTPTTLKCDENGNINVNVQVTSVDTPVIPANPPQNIPIDINAQTLTRISTRDNPGTEYNTIDVQTIPATGQKTILSISGDIILKSLYLKVSKATTLKDDSLKFIINTQDSGYKTLEQWLGFQTENGFGLPIRLTQYDDVNFVYAFLLNYPIHVKSSFQIFYFESSGDTVTKYMWYQYYKI